MVGRNVAAFGIDKENGIKAKDGRGELVRLRGAGAKVGDSSVSGPTGSFR